MNRGRNTRGASTRAARLWALPCRLHGFLLGLGLSLFTAPALAIDYHVSPANGDDGYDGLAQAPAGGSRGPFASLRRLEQLRLQHGDRVLLHCGERHTGPVRLRLDDRGGGALLIGSYGDCRPGREPVLDPRQPLPAPNRDGLLELAQPTPVVQVFVNDEPLPVGRFPAEGPLIVPANTDASDKRRLPTLAALAGKPLAGARLLARTEEWYIEERAVLSDDGQLDKPLEYALRPRTGLVLTGKRWMLKGGRGWVWDASSQQLTVQVAPDARLSAVTGGPLLEVAGKRGSLTVRGLVFDAAGGDAINVRLDGLVTIEDVTIRRAYGNGIAVAGARQALVQRNRIEDVAQDAVFFAEVRDAQVRGNTVAGAGMYVSGGPRPVLAAINAHRTDASVVEDNQVDRSAYHGIRIAADARVRNNQVRHSCLRLSDCAAIYTWRRNADDRRPRSEISGNVIEGVGGDTSVKLGVNDYFVGIYLDEFANDVNVERNVIVDANQGIYLHNAYNNSVVGNTVAVRGKPKIDAADDKQLGAMAERPKNAWADNVERSGNYQLATVDNTGRVGAQRSAASPAARALRVVRSGAAAADAKAARCTEASPMATYAAVSVCD
ncbi:parallel beta-helix repeat protein [Pelomonas saccharophila]|uniref:Parallel beta-helix repeat protein n=1 Tax=Roseateles saccharophilus TaxID=304 RepID=A0ABU1YU89_ROSSA|nr:right-handed parallel beta-helix repeat-containing protein [Roseateles saccharophilus]MDR7271775.1 parallel beta-helix repeat protein [Roseateles saccharophilus]